MSNIAERYIYLCRCYIELADRFQKLDVEHMSLKGKMVPILATLKNCKETIDRLTQENAELQTQTEALNAKYEQLKPLEAFLEPEFQAVLAEAEEQMGLVQETIQEMEIDSDPDLSEADKLLLEEYTNGSQALHLPELELLQELMNS